MGDIKNWQKFVSFFDFKEIHLTACAVSKMAGVDRLPELAEYGKYFAEPNQKWLENPSDERARVKIYFKLRPETDSVTTGRVQKIRIPMPFLGDSPDECWGELHMLIRKTIVRSGKKIILIR